MIRYRLWAAALLATGTTYLAVQTPAPAQEKKAETPAVPAPAAPTPAAPTPAAPAPAPAAPATPAVNAARFETKFEKDKAFYQEIETVVLQTIKVQNNADLQQRQSQTFYFKWLPTNFANDKWTVKQTIEGAKMSIDIAGNKVEYDSTNTAAGGAAGNPGLADFFSKLVGTEFTITYSKGMVVEKVEGKDDFIKKLGGVNPQMEALFKKMLTDEALKQMTDPSFGLTADKDIAVGGKWDKKSSISVGPIGSYDTVTTYTYTGKNTAGANAADKELEKVDVATTMTYKAPAADQSEGLFFKIKGGELKTEPYKAGEKVNDVLYNAKTGRVERSTQAVKLVGKLNVTMGGVDTTIDLFLEQTTTAKTGDTSFIPKK
ncbi:DUF6263 family protein [Limnoglobus roseus]|uniref:Uncharacterized protein n=1 Tax=Limnoglobus roseus TaxID=2598579 RepID=A0A5C1ACM1_9BACT|nr:DUF6263 family protein [Limnoglobus roseus]QEL15512.1 hypothetical protein PX52LOC_02436 [Limnoglobus roseus]